MHVGTAFGADAVQDAGGVAVRRCPACNTGTATYAENAGVMVMGCSTGCTPEQILTALYDHATGAATFPLGLPVRFRPPAETSEES